MASERWKHSKTTVYNIGFHLIWCPKFRRRVLEGEMPDHVHLFVKSSPTMSPHWIVQQLKGYTSRKLRQEFLELTTRLPTLWTRSYYCESVGHISEETIKKYIEEQKNK